MMPAKAVLDTTKASFAMEGLIRKCVKEMD